MFFFFFFQAEDGIRDLLVTGVQTCALPICPSVNSYAVHGFFFLVLFLLVCAGCAEPGFESLRLGDQGRYIENVPFFRQGEAACGPAALAGVLKYRGRPRTLDEITQRVYTPKLRGTLPMDMERYARE